MKRFENSTLEYNSQKMELVFRDAKTDKIFLGIEFSESKEIKRVFSLYPLSVELKDRILELKFSVENEKLEKNLLTLLIEIDQLTENKVSVLNIADENLDDILFS